jgi:hypothetical protein
MKMARCKFTVDKWGFYLTPLIGVEWTRGVEVWFGWLFFLWRITLKPGEEKARGK